METQPNIVVSLAILMHGKVINLDVNTQIFDNIRLISKVGNISRYSYS
jgi:hypothetical protein